jgi:Glu-tRNA(Gln) amidotransferase subunit E-like FAD-binding protein
MNNQFTCNNCDKEYKSYYSLWRHNKKYHSDINVTNVTKSVINVTTIPNELIKYGCKKCNELFSNRQNRWRHEKLCNVNNIIEKMQKEIDELKNKPTKTIIKNINQGTINKGPVYNFLNKIGNENINLLTEKEIEYIMDQELNCIISLISLLNFNQEIFISSRI